MAATSFEEAKICPKCNKPGEDRKTVVAPGLPRGTTVHTIYCVSVLCPWYETCWMVQVNPDGSIPPPQDHTRTEKVYVGFEGHDEMAKALVDELKASEKHQQDPGYEIKRRGM